LRMALLAARGMDKDPGIIVSPANVAFAKRFRNSGDSQAAFAVNLLGTIVGGCLEYAALFTGYDNLLLLTALLYLAAFLLIPKGAARSA